jgi:hypothetical protein
MKTLAILANGGWLLCLAVLCAKDPPHGNESWVPILMLATLLVNLWTLFFSKSDRNWISLFFERKALEEKKRIEALRTNQSERSNEP